VAQSPVSGTAGETPDETLAGQEVSVAQGDAAAKKALPNSSPRAESNGRVATLDGRPATKSNGARIVPRGWREVEEDAVPPVLPSPLDGGPAARHSGFSANKLIRVLAGLLLLWLIAGSVAIAAIATLRPEWLSGLVPGFSSTEVKSTPTSQEPKAKTGAPEPIVVPVPVPAVRPPSNDATGASDAAPAPRIEPARRPDADQPPAAPATSPAVPGPATGSEGASSGSAAGNSPATSPASAPPPAAAPSTTADPPLVEPERPAARPGRAP
jgi:hypothetical protein